MRRNAFGRPLVAPACLTREERVELVREVAKALAVGGIPSQYAARYLSDALNRWLEEGGDLERLLGLRPPRGSRRRVDAITKQGERDGLIVRFAAAVGSDRKAALVLRGEQACPPGLESERQALHACGVPQTASGIWKARRRASSHRG